MTETGASAPVFVPADRRPAGDRVAIAGRAGTLLSVGVAGRRMVNNRRGRVVKKVLLILGALFAVFLLVLAGIFALVFNVTSGMPETADRFFAAVRAGDIEAARAELSEEFKASTDASALQRFLADSTLTDVVETSWTNRRFENSRGSLDGTATTAGGGTVPLTMSFVEENDAWKIYAIDKPAAGFQDSSREQAELDMPSLRQRTALVKRSMHDFAMSLDEGDMRHFFGTLSTLWKSQTTPEELAAAFDEFYQQQIALLPLDAMQPVFTAEPTIDENGVLELAGRYETTPSPVSFSHRYILEGSDWKLIGIDVQIRPAE